MQALATGGGGKKKLFRRRQAPHPVIFTDATHNGEKGKYARAAGQEKTEKRCVQIVFIRSA